MGGGHLQQVVARRELTLLGSLDLKGHILGVHSQTQKLELPNSIIK